jgi:hypothetical protein
MPAKRLSPLDLPVSYEDLLERLFSLRELIYEKLTGDELTLGGIETLRLFQEDVAFREAMAEVLLASILWIEAGRSVSHILQDCEPEIRKGLVYTVNTLVEFLHIRKHTQPDALLNRGSLADAWIHLLVEFRDMLRDRTQDWLWRREQPPFVPGKYF